MNAPVRFLLLLALALAPLFIGGCASTPKEESTTTTAPVPTIPWNTPANWERSMPMGGTGVGY